MVSNGVTADHKKQINILFEQKTKETETAFNIFLPSEIAKVFQ